MTLTTTPTAASSATEQYALQVRGVSKSFGGNRVLRDVDLEVRPGTLHFVIGPNGAGKTTLFNVVSGFIAPDAGTVSLLGEDLTRARPRIRARHGMARTFQNLQLFDSLSVAENVLMAMHGRMKSGLARSIIGVFVSGEENREYARAYEWLERFGLEKYADARPQDLSYGDRRLVEIIRALVTQPRVLLLDEPAAGLGVAARRRLFEVLQGLHSPDLSIVLIEHDMKFGMGLADDVTVLDLGARIAAGTPEQIQRDPQVIAAYLGTGRKSNVD
jgi:branched-chain amino acid transport system ATP-binding protein